MHRSLRYPVDIPTELIVQSGTALSMPEPVTIAAQPAVFTQDQSGTGHGVVVHRTMPTVLTDSSNPAIAGETIVIYCTGLGAVMNPVPSGVAPTAADSTVQPFSITIGGQPAMVSYAGLTPGFPGLYQVNAVVPNGVAPGSQAPLVISTAGQTSPAITIAVH